MKVRAVTLGVDLTAPRVDAEPIQQAGTFLRAARDACQAEGIEVQTTRLAGPDLGPTLAVLGEGNLPRWAADIERAARDAGVEYLSLGRLPGAAHGVVAEQVAPLLAAGEIAFLSADLTPDQRPSIPMAAACARAVRELARSTPSGFGNLRFGATASCPPNIPFLPAAYHAGGPSRFAFAVQAADVVLATALADGSVADLEDRLVAALEEHVKPLERIGEGLERQFGARWIGVDLSPAPAPGSQDSIAGAIEAFGVERFGAPGTLFVAATITRAIRRTRILRCGFSGLMLPVLEDSLLADRYAERPLSPHELLLHSAVCGTGLDTLPLPGNISEAELAGIYLDVAALSVALGGKPLTARLFPVPDASPGAKTDYTFEYFHNTRVAAAHGHGAAGVLARG